LTYGTAAGWPVPTMALQVCHRDAGPDGDAACQRDGPHLWGAPSVLGSALFAAWAVGAGARNRRAYLDQLHARAQDLEREQDQRSRAGRFRRPGQPADSGTGRVIRVLLADDQALVRTGFRLVPENAPDMTVVGEAGDGAEAAAMALGLQPDVVLMDVRILAPGRRQRLLLKDSLAADLLSAIRVVARGDAVVSPSVTRRLIECYVDARPAQSSPTNDLDALTEREREVLALIAGGLSNTEIATRIYVTEGTVKTHVSRVLAKLGLRDRVQAVVYAYESGLVRPAPHRGP
jgi:DNA-binding NarL/FixJ family response regulator